MQRSIHQPLISGLSLLGLLEAGYLISTRIGVSKLACVVGTGCSTVQYSPYLNPFGIPISYFGGTFYLLMLILAVLLGQGRQVVNWIFGLATFGILFAGYLLYAQGVLIGQYCFWCVVSMIILALLLVTASLLYRSQRKTT